MSIQAPIWCGSTNAFGWRGSCSTTLNSRPCCPKCLTMPRGCRRVFSRSPPPLHSLPLPANRRTRASLKWVWADVSMPPIYWLPRSRAASHHLELTMKPFCLHPRQVRQTRRSTASHLKRPGLRKRGLPCSFRNTQHQWSIPLARPPGGREQNCWHAERIGTQRFMKGACIIGTKKGNLPSPCPACPARIRRIMQP